MNNKVGGGKRFQCLNGGATSCGLDTDRDVNACLNILLKEMSRCYDVCGAKVDPNRPILALA